MFNLSTMLFLAFGFLSVALIGLYDLWCKDRSRFTDLPPLAAGFVAFIVGCLTFYDTLVPMWNWVQAFTNLPPASFPSTVVCASACILWSTVAVYWSFAVIPRMIIGRDLNVITARDHSWKGFMAFVFRRLNKPAPLPLILSE